MKTKLTILICAILIAVVVGRIWVAISGWPPLIICNSEYRKLISNFQQAQLRDKIKSTKGVASDRDGWDFQVDVPESQITAKIQAPEHNGAVRIQYKDENTPNCLYESVGYSHVQEIRIDGNILYVRWVEIMLNTKHWLLAYDLADRREIVRRKIDPQDLEKTYVPSVNWQLKRTLVAGVEGRAFRRNL